MRAQEARTACPDLLLRPLDLSAAETGQSALLAELSEWQLPVEPLTWGSAYVDLHAVAKDRPSVQPLITDAGRRLRQRLGADLQPSLGWDSGKFTARAAACVAPPGRMRLVDKADEARFLNPLPITLLPLPRPHLQQLHWLGIRTLGEFAALPAAGVTQRFGAPGRQAQRWAQGRDDRPVRAAVADAPAPVAVTLDPPASTLQPMVGAVMASLPPVLAARAEALEGVRRLRIVVSFVAGADQAADVVFVEPASQAARVEAALVQQLVRMRWPSEAEAVRWTLPECGELSAPQLGLFGEPAQGRSGLAEVAGKLAGRYGGVLMRASVVDAGHPVAERRGGLVAIGPGEAPD